MKKKKKKDGGENMKFRDENKYATNNAFSTGICEKCVYNKLKYDEEPCYSCYADFFIDGNFSNFMEATGDDDVDEAVKETVNHPDHYNNGVEAIVEMEEIFGLEAVMNFCLLNVWKYRKRAIYKNGEEDMKKADWYYAKYIELKNEFES